MKTHLADDYLFNMQSWNKDMAQEGFNTLKEEGLNPMANYCSGRHSKNSAPEPTFNIDQVTCKNCLKKYKKENK